MSVALALASVVALSALSLGVARADPGGTPPRLFVTFAMPTAQTYDNQVITVTSLAASVNGSWVPSHGPVSIAVIDARQQPLPGVGCSACKLNNGTASVFVPIGEDFPTGWVTVEVRDNETGLSVDAQFQVVLSSSYLLLLWRRQLAEMNATAQANLQAAIGQAIEGMQVAVASMFVATILILLAAQHRIARAKHLMSWRDRILIAMRWGSPNDPMDLVFSDKYSRAKYIPARAEKDAAQARLQRSVDTAQRLSDDLRKLTIRRRMRMQRKLARLERMSARLEPKVMQDRASRLREEMDRVQALFDELDQSDRSLEEKRVMARLPKRDLLDEWVVVPGVYTDKKVDPTD